MGDGSQLVALTVDTPAGRTVTFWTPDDMEKMARGLLNFIGKAPDGLVIAGLDELRKIGDGR